MLLQRKWEDLFISDNNSETFYSAEIEMLVDDPKDYEELHEMALDQEMCIHITEDMLTMSPDQTNGYSGTVSLQSGELAPKWNELIQWMPPVCF